MIPKHTCWHHSLCMHQTCTWNTWNIDVTIMPLLLHHKLRPVASRCILLCRLWQLPIQSQLHEISRQPAEGVPLGAGQQLGRNRWMSPSVLPPRPVNGTILPQPPPHLELQ